MLVSVIRQHFHFSYTLHSLFSFSSSTYSLLLPLTICTYPLLVSLFLLLLSIILTSTRCASSLFSLSPSRPHFCLCLPPLFLLPLSLYLLLLPFIFHSVNSHVPIKISTSSFFRMRAKCFWLDLMCHTKTCTETGSKWFYMHGAVWHAEKYSNECFITSYFKVALCFYTKESPNLMEHKNSI